MPPTHNANGVPLVTARKSGRRSTYRVDREYIRLREEHEKRRAVESSGEPMRATTLSQPFGTRSKQYKAKTKKRRHETKR